MVFFGKAKPVKIGILGLASIARRSVIPAIKMLPKHFILTGIASRNLAKCEQISSEIECRGYHSYESLLLDSEIEAVYIPLPNALHYQYAKMALEQRKHVLVEKSMGCTLQQVVGLNTIAEKNRLVLIENFQFRFHSQLTTIIKLVNNGIIGNLRSVRIDFGFPPFSDSTNIRYSDALGGGALFDVGAYPIKLAPYFLGQNIEVAHASMTYDSNKGVDIWGGGVLKQKEGSLLCHFSYGFDHHYQCTLDLWGSLGKLSTNRIFTAPPDLTPILRIERLDGIEERILPKDNHFINMLAYFYQLITEGQICDVEYNKNTMQASLIEKFRFVAGEVSVNTNSTNGSVCS